jgi:predicted nucleotidyltransferase
MSLPRLELPPTDDVAERIARQFASLPQVEAVALAGSRTSAFPDSDSDVDLYVYITDDVSLDSRRQIAAGSARAEIGNATWEPGDEWVDAETGARVDVMYRHVRWIEEQLDRVLVQHQASVGYSTCFWYNVLRSRALFDHTGWFAALQWGANVRYPAKLKQSIIAKNYPLLRRNQSSYLHQIELAVKRSDPVSVNHRVTALLASYFDVLFAVNELPHPGEKRLLRHAAQCAQQPQDMVPHVLAVVEAVGDPRLDLTSRIHQLVDGLEGLMRRQSLGELTGD